jgi:hypothetical protein
MKLSHSDPEIREKAAWFKRQPGCAELFSESEPQVKGTPTLHITRREPFLSWNEERLHFHPSMALLRLINIFRGEDDRFLHAVGLKRGDRFLDLTLGLGTDALIAAWAVGEEGSVLGVERSAVLGALVRDGLLRLNAAALPPLKNELKFQAWAALKDVSSRIQVVWAEHLSYLSALPSASADVVYFDPMFRHTRRESSSLRPLRDWADPRELLPEAVRQACRVARRRVVLKERKDSAQFSRLGFVVCPGGKYSPVDFGVIEVIACRRS